MNITGKSMASRIFAIVGVALAAAGAAQAQTATQNVTYAVNAINQIAVSGSPTLTVSTATAGSGPNAVTSSASTWAVTTNQTSRKLTASISSNMDTGLTLSLTAAAPAGATSAGKKALSTTAVDLVTGISQVAQGGMSLTFELAATLAAGVVASSSRTVTYTIVAGP
jgi:hypothetical protein